MPSIQWNHDPALVSTNSEKQTLQEPQYDNVPDEELPLSERLSCNLDSFMTYICFPEEQMDFECFPEERALEEKDMTPVMGLVEKEHQHEKLGISIRKMTDDCIYIYKIEDKKTIKIEKSGPRENSYEDFCSDLPEKDCRYGLIDLDFTTTDGRPTSKLVLITWNPDTASIRSKMLYSGSKEALKTALNGVGVHINATDRSELDFESSVLPACQKFA